jgi:hypothetical protein
MSSPDMTRRRFLATAAVAGGAALTFPNVITSAKAAGKNELVFVGFGGSYQDGQTKALFEPFEKETGIKVVQTTGVDLAKLRAQQQSNNVEWDLISIPDRLRYTAVRDGLLQPLNYSAIPNAKDVQKNLVTEYAVGCVTIPMLLTYSTKAYPGGKAPQNWHDFWDPTKFPGPRGYYNAPPYSLEFALIADGVPKDKLYPLDVNRAFKSLDRVKPAVKVWWSQFPHDAVDALDHLHPRGQPARHLVRRRGAHLRGVGRPEERAARRQRDEVHQLGAAAQAPGRADQVHRVRAHQRQGHAVRRSEAQAAAVLEPRERREGLPAQRRLVGPEPRQGDGGVERVAPQVKERP